MKTVTALWRSMEGSDWTLIALFDNGPSGEGGNVRHQAVRRIHQDISKWTLPVSYKITIELVEPEGEF